MCPPPPLLEYWNSCLEFCSRLSKYRPSTLTMSVPISHYAHNASPEDGFKNCLLFLKFKTPQGYSTLYFRGNRQTLCSPPPSSGCFKTKMDNTRTDEKMKKRSGEKNIIIRIVFSHIDAPIILLLDSSKRTERRRKETTPL